MASLALMINESLVDTCDYLLTNWSRRMRRRLPLWPRLFRLQPRRYGPGAEFRGEAAVNIARSAAQHAHPAANAASPRPARKQSIGADCDPRRVFNKRRLYLTVK